MDQAIIALPEKLVRIALSVILATTMLAAAVVQAQVTTEDPLDPELPREERICELEIARVEEALDESKSEFGGMERARMETQLDEARGFCEDGNEIMRRSAWRRSWPSSR
jgi:hypothetical protein